MRWKHGDGPTDFIFLGSEFGKTGGHLDHFFDLRRVIVEIPRQALGDFVNGQVIEDQVDFSDRSPGPGGLLCAWRVNNIAGWNGR